jgi:hypothetical protein
VERKHWASRKTGNEKSFPPINEDQNRIDETTKQSELADHLLDLGGIILSHVDVGIEGVHNYELRQNRNDLGAAEATRGSIDLHPKIGLAAHIC